MTNNLVKWDTLLQIATISDVGMRRTSNQDNFFVSLASTMDQWHRRGHLFIVADGMGAHAAGELASKIAVDHIPHLYAKFSGEDPPEGLRRAIAEANSEIHRRGQVHEEFHNMGTTCSSMLLMPEGVYCGHVGDSRVYRVRGGRIDQFTFDHSLVWEMKASGQLGDDADFSKIPKNVITRSLGPYAEIKVDVEGPFPVEVGDSYLLCSDGLTGQVSDEEIGVVLAMLEPTAAAHLLVDIANLRGGPDNITIIIAKVIDPQLTGIGSSRVGRSQTSAKKPPMIHPLSWMALGVSLLLAAAIYYSTGSIPNTSIPLAVSILSLIWIFIQMIRGLNAAGGEPRVPQRGQGPYTHKDLKSAGWVFVNNMKEMIAQIRAASESGGLNLNTGELGKMLASAEKSDSSKDLKNAIRGYGAIISYLMEQLRNHSESIDIEQ